MKNLNIIVIALLVTNLLSAQIPNASFEDWSIINSIEQPSNWNTNNVDGFISVTKVPSLSDGDFAMKIITNGMSFEGLDTGEANVKFLPNNNYDAINMEHKIDSISQGKIIVKISQLVNGNFQQIGYWETDQHTLGVEDLNIPISQLNLDSIKIDIFATNTITATGNEGYSEIVLDKLELFSTTSTTSDTQNDILVYPNPSDGRITIEAMDSNTKYNLYSISGKLVQTGMILNNHIFISKNGNYILKIQNKGNWIETKVTIKQ